MVRTIWDFFTEYVLCVCSSQLREQKNSISAVANAHVWICEKMAHEIMWHLWVIAIFIKNIIFPMWYLSSSQGWTSLLEICIIIIHHKCIISSKCIHVISFNCLNLTYTNLMNSTLGQSQYWSSLLSPLKVIHIIQLTQMTDHIWLVNLIYELVLSIVKFHLYGQFYEEIENP
jgi:hypothetical protein